MDNIIRLRPHHFLCMLTYIGKGYSQAFIDNYSRIIHELNTGDKTIELINGADDICAPRLCDANETECHCRESHIDDRDNEALSDIRKMSEFSDLKIGNRINLTENLIKSLRKAYKENTIRTACIGCEWKDLCDGITHENFKGTKLK
jgi:uncharacterized protein